MAHNDPKPTVQMIVPKFGNKPVTVNEEDVPRWREEHEGRLVGEPAPKKPAGRAQGEGQKAEEKTEETK